MLIPLQAVSTILFMVILALLGPGGVLGIVNESSSDIIWQRIEATNYSFEAPYSPTFGIGQEGYLPTLVSEESVEGRSIVRFGDPLDTAVPEIREYFIYQGPLIDRELLLDSLDWGCAGMVRARTTQLGNILGVSFGEGGARGCAAGFAFSAGEHSYYLHRLSTVRHDSAALDDEVTRIAESLRED